MKYAISKLLIDAAREHRAVPAFNVYNLETVEAVAIAAQKAKAPVIFAFGESYLGGTTLAMIAAIVNEAAQARGLDYALHLDHAKSPQTVMAALATGFTSVMFDGSALTLEENIAKTAALTQEAHRWGASIEGELGYLNPEDGSGAQDMGEALHTTVSQGVAFVAGTGVDALAVAVGNAHGIYHTAPKLNLTRIGELADAVKIPLVLHGCSGIPAAQLRQGAALGVCKMNVNTELALVGAKAILEMSQPNLRLEKAMNAARNAMEQTALTVFRELKEEELP